MAIIKFTFDADKVPADAVNVEENLDAGSGKTYWTWHTFVGLCLSDREYNGYDDSDWAMTVWNAEKGEPEEIVYASTRGWTYPAYGSFVDATAEVRDAFMAWQAEQIRLSNLARLEADARVAQHEAEQARPGREVEVVKGRKVPVGTIGRCFWRGFGKFGERVGLTTASGETFWTAADNCKAVLV